MRADMAGHVRACNDVVQLLSHDTETWAVAKTETFLGRHVVGARGGLADLAARHRGGCNCLCLSPWTTTPSAFH
jgi:hypothetical protein